MHRLKNKTWVAATAAVLCVTLSLPAAAQSLFYECDMNGSKRNKGWTSPKMAFILADNGSVKVVDGVILHFVGEAADGKVLRNNEKSMQVRWTVSETRSDNGSGYGKIDYLASLNKGSGRINVTVTPQGEYQTMRARGKCAIRKQ